MVLQSIRDRIPYTTHLTPSRDLLQEIGIPAQSGRTAAIRQLVLQMPSPVVAQAPGYHHNSTTRIAAEAGSPWSGYAPGDHIEELMPDILSGTIQPGNAIVNT